MKALILSLLILTAGCAESGMNSVTYRGHEIRLSRTYSDFHEYRDDERNLPPDEIAKVAALIKEAPVAATYPTRDAAFQALYSLMFPGYGFSNLNLSQPVALYAIEIPRMQEERYVSFVERDGSWVLVEDFIWPSGQSFIHVAEIVDGKIRYSDGKGNVLREHSL